MNIFRFSAIATVSAILAALPVPVRANPQAAANLHNKQQQVYSLLDRCQPALSQRVGGRISISVDTLQDYFVSNAENGLTGQGILDAGGSFRQFTFNCLVNIRDGRVTSVTTSLDPSVPNNPNPPSNGFTAIVDTPNGQPIVLRYGPGTEYFEIDRVPNGQSLTLNGRSNGNWAQTTSGTWVYRPYLRIVQ